MEAKDVLNLPWKEVTDWSKLSASKACMGQYFVCATDVNIFVENIYRDISQRLNIPYEHLKPILKAENSAFYTLKERLFKAYTGYGKGSSALIKLQNTLRVPDISNVETVIANINVCLNLFEDLSDTEKMIFLQEIGRIRIKGERFAVQTEETVEE